jgi:hypothetical protein
MAKFSDCAIVRTILRHDPRRRGDRPYAPSCDDGNRGQRFFAESCSSWGTLIMTMRIQSILTVGMAISAALPAAAAENYSLGFASLPSAQGWNYLSAGDGAGIPDTNLYTATGTGLLQNTIGIPMTVGGHNFYKRAISIDSNADFVLSASVRVSQFEGINQGGNTSFPYGMFLAVSTTTGYSSIGFAGTRFVYINPAAGLTYGDFAPGFDVAAFNDYGIRRVAGLTTLSINGVDLVSYLAPVLGGDTLEFGDGTGFGNGAGEYRSLTFRSGVVPEPASWAMLVAGFGIVGGTLRSRRRTAAIGA